MNSLAVASLTVSQLSVKPSESIELIVASASSVEVLEACWKTAVVEVL